MNVAAGLWYTLARLEISEMSSSRIAGETVVCGKLIGGRTDNTTDCSSAARPWQYLNASHLRSSGI